jgi:predicted  nucleic acid-binding Zn-ribbon protein
MKKSSSVKLPKNEILEAIELFSRSVDQKFEKIDQQFDKIDQRFNKIEATMVTKEYLDEKMDEQKSELEKMIRGTDDKLKMVSKKLTSKKIFTPQDHQEILRLKPFAETI